MKYTIKTLDASQKLATMISCVKKGKDQKGKDIDTWGIDKSEKGEVFVHTREQWDQKCCIYCEIPNQKEENIIKVEFYYWSKCKQEDRTEYDEGIVLGRFTELLINHFADLNIKIEIEP